MNKKTVLVVIILVAIIGVLFFVGQPKNKSIEAQTETTVQETGGGLIAEGDTFHDFGTISMKDGNVSKLFAVKNESAHDITISELYTSCMCTNAFFISPAGNKKGPFGMPGMGDRTTTRDLVRPGETFNIEVVYDPNAHGPAGVGMIDRFVTVKDKEGDEVEFEIKAQVTP